MKKKKGIRENLINRDQYNRIKKMDRQDMEEFLWSIYEKGYAEGKKAIDSDYLKNKIVEVLNQTPGVGDKTISKVLVTLDTNKECN